MNLNNRMPIDTGVIYFVVLHSLTAMLISYYYGVTKCFHTKKERKKSQEQIVYVHYSMRVKS